MKILLVDNSAVIKKGNSYNTNKLNGLFLKELMSFGNKIKYFQLTSENENTISTYDLKANGIDYNPIKKFNNKFIQYIYAHIIIIPSIINTDFVYFYYPSSFKFATFLCKLLGKKYGLYIRGERGIEDTTSLKIYKNAFTIFTVSESFTKNINILLGEEKAITIRPMIPFTDEDIITDRSYKIKNKYNVLFLGRIARDKGIKELIEAAKILNDKGYKFVLNIVGNGELFTEASHIIKSLGIEDIAYLKGAVYEPEKVKKYYTNADVYILPTYHEGFPRTLYEAMIFGTPIITTFVGGIPSLMIDDYNCKEIKAKSVESIVEILEFAFNNYDKMIEFANNGEETVEKIVDSKRLTHAQHLNKIISRCYRK